MRWAAIVAGVAMAASACVRVRASQREHLAAPRMQVVRDAQATEMTEHVYESREGSAGGAGGSGGGCGCN